MSIDVPGALLTIDAAAEYLSVTPRLVRKLVATRELPSVKVGRLVRITPAALTAYIQANVRTAP
jgi:excisionase family DNA binding protein